jgi:hypothetical protein
VERMDKRRGRHTGEEDVPPVLGGYDVRGAALEHRHVYRSVSDSRNGGKRENE